MVDRSQPAPFEEFAQLEDLGDCGQRAGVAVPAAPRGRIGFPPRTGLLRVCFNTIQVRLQQIERFETGNGDRLAVMPGNEIVGPRADHHADMAGPDKSVQPQVGRIEDRLDRWNDRDVIAEQREVACPLGTRLDQRHRRARHRGFEAEAEEHHLPLRVLAGQRQRVQRRIDHPHVGALGLRLQQALARSRHAHGVAEGGEDHLRSLRQRHAVIDAPHRQHADRAAWAVHVFHRVRQHLLDAVAEDRVGVATAHFHDLQRPPARGRNAQQQPADVLHQRTRLGRIAELVDVFHAGGSISPPRSSASRV